jgi:hypothetical protein
LVTLWAEFQRNRPGNAVVGIKTVHHEAVEVAIALPKLDLCLDRLALSLLFRTDADVNRKGHQGVPVVSTT